MQFWLYTKRIRQKRKTRLASSPFGKKVGGVFFYFKLMAARHFFYQTNGWVYLSILLLFAILNISFHFLCKKNCHLKKGNIEKGGGL